MWLLYACLCSCMPARPLWVCMYVKIRGYQHTRVHAHTGPRRHARAPACRRHHIYGVSTGRHSTQTTITIGSPSLCTTVGRCVVGLETLLGPDRLQDSSCSSFPNPVAELECLTLPWRLLQEA